MFVDLFLALLSIRLVLKHYSNTLNHHYLVHPIPAESAPTATAIIIILITTQDAIEPESKTLKLKFPCLTTINFLFYSNSYQIGPVLFMFISFAFLYSFFFMKKKEKKSTYC